MREDGEIGKLYFDWLYNMVCPPLGGRASYRTVCEHMNHVVFDWSVPNDDNRAAEGKELRYEFFEEADLPQDADTQRFTEPDASVFEVIVALCRRADFQAERGINNWFRIILENLGLIECSDDKVGPKDAEKIDRVILKMNSRRYRPNGRGGLFPLRNPTEDQREVELWYQLAKYLIENEMF
jgi:hypothetical protein